MDSMAAAAADGAVGAGSYQVAVLAPQQQRQSYWYSSWAWWKPSTNDMFETRPAPPSYDVAMMHSLPGVDGNQHPQPQHQQLEHHHQLQPQQHHHPLHMQQQQPQQHCRGGSDHSDDCSSLESNGSEAPPYSEIHLDPVIVEPTEWFRQQAAAQHHQQQQPQAGQPPQYPSRPATLPCGAALVLPPVPAAPFNTLNHVETPSERQQSETNERQQQPHHHPSVNLVNENRPQPATTSRTTRSSRRRDDAAAAASSTTTNASRRAPGNATLPHVIRRLRARSREGIVLPPEERDAVLQRFSLQLNLNLSSDGSSSTSTINTMSPERRAAATAGGSRPRSMEPPMRRQQQEERISPISSASSEEEY